MKRVKKFLVGCAAAALSAFILQPAAFPDDYVQPQTLSGVSLYRDATSIAYTTNTYYTQGASLLITNLTVYSTANLGTNSVVQGLAGVTVEAAVSESSTSTGTWTTATVISTNGGTLSVTIPSLPSVSTPYWQLRLTDASTNIYYYEKQIIRANPHL